jgi:hypothetical protein
MTEQLNLAATPAPVGMYKCSKCGYVGFAFGFHPNHNNLNPNLKSIENICMMCIWDRLREFQTMEPIEKEDE